MKNVEIARAEREDIPEIVNLFQGYDFALTNRQWLEWKYFDNPVGKALMFKILLRRELVGAVAIMPQLFHFSGRPIVGLQTVDGLLGAQIRGKGFFNELMYFLSVQRPEGISKQTFYLSFPSLAVSVKAHENAGWRRLADFELTTAILNPARFFQEKGLPRVGRCLALLWKGIKNSFIFPPDGGISTKEISGRLPDLNAFLPESVVTGDRSEAFTNWRVGENPRDRMALFEFRKEAHPIGYAICKFLGHCVEVPELRTKPGMTRQATAALLRHIDENRLGASVDFWSLGRSPATLRPSGFGFFKRRFSGALFINHHRRCQLPEDPAKWAISYLDSDW